MDINNIKTIQFFRSANMGRFNLHIKRSVECETVAKLWSNDRV